MAILCVDAGTTMVKAVLFDEDGRELKVVRQSTEVFRRGPGYSEQDMYSVWDAVVYTVRSVVHGVTEPVRLLSITGQGDGCWLVGADGRPTGPAMLWNDGRAASIVDEWERRGVLDEAYRINGSYGFPGTSGAIMSWLRTHDPERLEKSHKALYCTGWIFLKLTGEYAVEESDAASPFLDIRAREYSSELLDLYDMPWVERLLPTVRSTANRVSELHPLAAVELRLPTGLPVVIAPFDIPVTAIGVGAVAPQDACTILGTTLSTGTVSQGVDTSGMPAGMTLPAGLPGTYLRSIAAMSGVETVSWAMKLIGLDNPNWLSDLAQTTSPGAEGIVFLPYLSPAGERAPFRDAAARGSVVGLSFEHTKSHIARAMLEGLSYVVRDCLNASGIQPQSLRLTGGGANSTFWCQLLADITGVPSSRSVDSEIGAKGAFITALVAIGEEPSVTSAVERFVHVRDVFEPDADRTAIYEDLYQEFLAVRDHEREQWPRLEAVRKRHSSAAAVADGVDDNIVLT